MGRALAGQFRGLERERANERGRQSISSIVAKRKRKHTQTAFELRRAAEASLQRNVACSTTDWVDLRRTVGCLLPPPPSLLLPPAVCLSESNDWCV
ncbi:MAG: hypothetical protein MHMPM18_001933 [Marteilia pararefringens]